ncbi:MAG TPA: hypothetical protein PKY83_03660 [Bacteroidales bacterium]|nr:hypothetical protein [Bacteroidales bacterium]MCZ2415999.1 hypothetical protein [Burkholderiales bacterium]OQC57753.1 MAG: hypothetical protein BWX52_00778 [Bacteroidetes bacterium ADurb.Bin013]MBP8999489.1 hypothetical protein [Bacteroidales bacterium]MBV6456170.1 hypothetical protein [Bacteroidales bacterium]
MKRSIIIFFLCFVTLPAFSQEVRVHKSEQERKAEREAVQSQKIAFITQEVGLTPAEAEKFWPLYNEMERKVREVVHKRNNAKAEMYKLFASDEREKKGSGVEPAGYSQGRTAAGDQRDAAEIAMVDNKPKGPAAPVEDLLASYMNSFQEENTVRMEYHQKFLHIMPAAQVARFYLAEERFSNKMLRQYIENKVQEKSR